MDEKVYDGLHRVIGLVKPHLSEPSLEASYRELARFEESDKEARDWVDGVSGDVGAMLDEAFRSRRIQPGFSPERPT